MEMESIAAEQKTKDKWNKIYRSIDQNAGQNTDGSVKPVACEVLAEYQHLLPPVGQSVEDVFCLDVACGLGGNALFLAEHGFKVAAIDISSVAIGRIESYQHQNIKTLCSSIDHTALSDCRYDVVVVSRYLDRKICDALIDSLNPEGLLFYQTFTQEKVNPDVGPGNPEFLLAPNELLSLFSRLKVLAFSDQGIVGMHTSGFRNQSWLVAQKA